MTVIEDEAAARGWLRDRLSVSRETEERLERYAALVAEENERQNLVARSTLGPQFWSRHIVDSAQLIPLAGQRHAAGDVWLDLGSGPGLPGLVVAIIAPSWRMELVESRRLRCDFLRRCVELLCLGDRVRIREGRVETLPASSCAVISARAFAPLPGLMAMAARFAGKETVWLLPKGKNAVKELSTLPPAWQDMFHVEPSVTAEDAGILVGSGIPPATGRAGRR